MNNGNAVKNRKAKTWYIVLGVLLFLLAASLCLNIVVLGRLKSARIMDYSQVGLYPLMDADIKEMFVDQGNDPSLRGSFSDEEAAGEILELLRRGCYQAAPEPARDNNPGTNSYPFIRFTTDEHTFSLAALGDRVRISVDGSSECYYSNIDTELKIMILDILNEHFPK